MRVPIIIGDLFDLSPSEVISTQLPGGIEHFGILTERNTVISASKLWQAIVEESPWDFSRGAPMFTHGVWSDQPWWQAVWNARSQLGKPYHLFDGNCEHFVRFCHGLRQESPQLWSILGKAIVGGALVWALTSAVG